MLLTNTKHPNLFQHFSSQQPSMNELLCQEQQQARENYPAEYTDHSLLDKLLPKDGARFKGLTMEELRVALPSLIPLLETEGTKKEQRLKEVDRKKKAEDDERKKEQVKVSDAAVEHPQTDSNRLEE